MDTWQKIFVVLATIVAIMMGFFVGRLWPKETPNAPIKEKVDTLFIHDTITQIKPISVTRRVVDSVLVPVTDTMRLHDTLYVYLGREQVRWEDSLSVVYASGIQPQVDSVVHYTTQMVITKEIPVEIVRRTRWGIGIQAGYGVGVNGLTPYVGVGLSYNLLSW